MAIAARRLGLDPAELARRNLIAGRRDALPHAVGCALRLRATTRPASTRRSSSPTTTTLRDAGRRARVPRGGSQGSGSPASSSRRSRTWATSRSPRRPTSGRSTLPKSGNAEGASIAIDPHGGITVRLATTPQGQGHRTVCAQVVADVLGCDAGRRHGDVRDGHRERAVDRRVRQLLVPVLRRRGRRRRRRRRSSSVRRSTPSARTPATRRSRCGASRAWRTGIPEGLPEGEEPGLAAVAFWAPPNLDPPDADDRVASSAAHGFIVDVCAVEVDRETGRGARARLRHGARRRAGCSTRSSPTARCSAGSPTAPRQPSTSATSTTSRAT